MLIFQFCDSKGYHSYSYLVLVLYFGSWLLFCIASHKVINLRDNSDIFTFTLCYLKERERMITIVRALQEKIHEACNIENSQFDSEIKKFQ